MLEAKEYVEKKKTKLFRYFLKKPKKNEVHAPSLELTYEPFMFISGTYLADYYRKAFHPIKVDANVREVKLGDGIFSIDEKSSIRKRIQRSRAKNTIQLEVEEHVYVNEKKEICLDHHGMERSFSYKVDIKYLERYPDVVLEQNKTKQFEITIEAAIKKLAESLRGIEIDFQEVRDLNEQLTIDEIVEVYVPVYEARLVGPRKKVEILRLDGIKKKEL